MQILFTGASSFTGYWFVKELTNAGHDCYIIFRKNSVEEYERIRKFRVEDVSKISTTRFSCNFGDNNFIDFINSNTHWDVFCHHAADVTNYKSEDFSIPNALENNTSNLSKVIDILKDKRCNNILYTGSIFEGHEGAGSENLIAFSKYGLSKQFTFQMLKYFAINQAN